MTAPLEHAAYERGYNAGHADALAEIEARGRTVLALVDRPWRAVQPGDLIAAPGGTTWIVQTCAPLPNGHLGAALTNGTTTVRRPDPADPNDPGLDPDSLAQVWVPMPEHIALTVLRKVWPQLGHIGNQPAPPASCGTWRKSRQAVA